MPCSACNGKGQVDDNTRLWKATGEMMRTRRLAQDKSQREYADWLDIDVVTYSKAEHGQIDPKDVHDRLRAKAAERRGFTQRRRA